MLTCINPFEVEFKRDREAAYIGLLNTIPTHQFTIDDAGLRTTLNWIPEVHGVNMTESLAAFDVGQEVQFNRWYGINYPCSSFDSTKEIVHSWIEAMVGATLLYHHNTRRSNDELLIGEGNGGILFNSRVWTSGVGSTRLGISFFAKSDHDVSALARQLAQQTIVEPSAHQKYLHYLSSIGRLLQPEIEGLSAIDWLTQRIETARTDAGLPALVNDGGMSNLLDWREPSTAITWILQRIYNQIGIKPSGPSLLFSTTRIIGSLTATSQRSSAINQPFLGPGELYCSSCLRVGPLKLSCVKMSTYLLHNITAIYWLASMVETTEASLMMKHKPACE